MNIKTAYLPIYIFSLLAIGVIVGKYMNFPNQNSFLAKNNHKSKINRLIDFIDNDYVDKVNTDSIVNLTVDNILSKLDPHSVYIPPPEQEQEAVAMKGNFVGIGINFFILHDSVVVVKPIKNGPAANAGIQIGDRILFANTEKLFGKKITNEVIFSKLKGKEISDVALTVYRKSQRKTLKIQVKRALIPLKSIDVALLLKESTGYIAINRFSETTYNEFKTALTKLQKQKINSLIIDLRDNGGGYMEQAIAIADEFLNEKQLIVFTKDRKNKIVKTFATKIGSFETGKLTLLLNENSASASEILAGAIQDNDRGTIIGRRSFGKGLVQREMNFEDGSAVRLTVARYFTPTGRSIQKPYKNGKEAYFKDFEKRFQNGELYSKDSIKVNDSLKFKTPRGKLVYGGGGIVPDVFVPLEIKSNQEDLEFILSSGIISHFIFEQLDKSKIIFSGLNEDQIAEKVCQNNSFCKEFISYLKKNEIEIKLNKNNTIFNKYLTAEVIKQLFEEEKYYHFILKDDQMIKAAFSNH